MTRELSTIKDELKTAKAEAKLADLRAGVAHGKVEKLVKELQATCTHPKTKTTSSYHSGGYDFCAETFYSETCTSCDKIIRTWEKMHHGIYG